EKIDRGEVCGGAKAVAPHPTDADILYVGTVNGGVWKTTSARAARPCWDHQTDDQRSLSIGALEFDPTDALHQTLVAGMGRFSSLLETGGVRAGLLRTINGGTLWTPIDGSGRLTGLNISAVAPRGDTIVIAANAADNDANTGIWRSTDTG